MRLHSCDLSKCDLIDRRTSRHLVISSRPSRDNHVNRAISLQSSYSYEVLDLISKWRLDRELTKVHDIGERRQQNLNDELELLYEDLEETFYSKRGYIIPKKERLMIDNTGGSGVYGEVLGDGGIDKILSKLELTESSVFVDLGSGLGRAVFQVALSTPARAIGIELSDTRQQQARWILDQLSQKYDMSRVELRTEDITTCDFEGGTHFLLLSTAFSASGVRMIVEKLHKTESFECLICSRTIPPSPLLTKIGEFNCSYSWNLKGTAHVYCKPGKKLPHASTLAAFYSDQGLAFLPSDRPWALPIAAEEIFLNPQNIL